MVFKQNIKYHRDNTHSHTHTHAQSHVTQAGNVNKKLKTLITQTSWPRFHFIAFYLVGFVLFQVFTEIWPILLTACLSSGFHLHFRLSVNRETTLVNNQGRNHHRWTTTNRVQFEVPMKLEISINNWSHSLGILSRERWRDCDKLQSHLINLNSLNTKISMQNSKQNSKLNSLCKSFACKLNFYAAIFDWTSSMPQPENTYIQI